METEIILSIIQVVGLIMAVWAAYWLGKYSGETKEAKKWQADLKLWKKK